MPRTEWRKKLAEGEEARRPISFRLSNALRARLERAARKSGRSLAQEIETRLELSLKGSPLRNVADVIMPSLSPDEVEKFMQAAYRNLMKQLLDMLAGTTEHEALLREMLVARFGRSEAKLPRQERPK